MPNPSPALVNFSVISKSSLLGSGFPDGWLWIMIIFEAEFFIAGLKIALQLIESLNKVEVGLYNFNTFRISEFYIETEIKQANC